jgi:hypothetical protein
MIKIELSLFRDSVLLRCLAVFRQNMGQQMFRMQNASVRGRSGTVPLTVVERQRRGLGRAARLSHGNFESAHVSAWHRWLIVHVCEGQLNTGTLARLQIRCAGAVVLRLKGV